MKIAIGSWGYRKWFDEGRCDFASFLKEVKKIGAEGVEIFPWHIVRADTKKALKRIKSQCDRLGLGISTLICGNDFALPKIADRAAHVANMVRDIHDAVAVGIPHLNVFTGYHRDGADPEREVARVVDCFREVMPVAEAEGITLCIENHSSVHPDADGLLALLRAVGSPNLRPNPDPSNFLPNFTELPPALREPIYKDTAKIAPLAANAHLKIRDFTPDGDHAHLDVPRILSILKQAGYNGWIVLEYFGDDDPHEPNALGVALLRRLLRKR
jgi:sugar phosphate isomerase/epimerase